MVEVKLWGSLVRLPEATTNSISRQEISVSSSTGWLNNTRRLSPISTRGVAVSIDGVIYRDSWSKELPQDAEIYLLPRIAGG